ncbi:hypothetical protein [Candidatus Nanohalococcus occultus]|uniref:Uncharacterized protein n=1 Tax=Candidatus Nanohalococcus occultus TaxID=2978047 RepID=A0ABY8CIS5_9ARCH|nr:hypothetical protein SVXNc_0563 [Candidatus Nanohaloarchaeota archaeon SVXNc]
MSDSAGPSGDEAVDEIVSVRMSDDQDIKALEIIEGVAETSEDNSTYTKSHIFRYAIDRMLAGRENYEPDLTRDRKLESLLQEKAKETGYALEFAEERSEAEKQMDLYDAAVSAHRRSEKQGKSRIAANARDHILENFENTMYAGVLREEMEQ